MMMRLPTYLLAALLVAALSVEAFAQGQGDVIDPSTNAEPLYTMFSVKVSGGYSMGRARQIVGFNSGDAVYWSAGQGVKMDAAFDMPILPIEMINNDGEEYGPERIPYVGLELELGTGYHLSTGGTTNESLGSGVATTTRSYCYVPITLGLNARASFGPGLPSVYIGAGGGLHLTAVYEDHVTYSNSSISDMRTYDPPLPFELYGAMGMEFPLMYSADDGNSMVDLFAQVRLTEVTNYIYQYTDSPSNATATIVKTLGEAHSASNVALSLGIKINLY